MNKFKLRVTLIFLFQGMVLLYLLSVFMLDKYALLQESDTIKISTEVTSTLSKLVHNVQLERGISAGYITDKASLSKSVLINYRQKTDVSYANLINIIKLNKKNNTIFYRKLSYEIEPMIKNLVDSFNDIDKIREAVLKSNISFLDEIKYYTSINTKIINIIKIINHTMHDENINNVTIELLQYLKENAGLQRAYIYYELLSEKHDDNILVYINSIHENHLEYEQEFFIIASDDAKKKYRKYLDKETVSNLNNVYDAFVHDELKINDARRWFEISTLYINSLDEVLLNIFSSYIEYAQVNYKSAENSLYLAIFFGLMSLLALVVFFFILMMLISKEEDLIEDLKFSAYVFDSHEAMLITDIDGIIIKINDAFTTTTGYSREEAIGSNPSILKSNIHEKEFYENMWKDITSNGKWSGEIYNKRKNGDIYPELLSITVIRDDEDNITHFIAHFLDISELKEAQEKALFQANHDFLTGIMNRKSLTVRLEEEFERAKRHDIIEAFLFIDLDDFKAVNDSFGHKVGDSLLIEFTKRLESLFRKEDIIARLSGDEFAIIITNEDNDKEKLIKTTKLVCDKLISSASKEFIINEHIVFIGVSVGVCLFPQNHNTIDEIVHHGDLAMYKAKSAGKNRAEFYKY